MPRVSKPKIFDTFFTLFVRNEDRFGVKSVEKHISRHKNGTFYLRVRKNGKLFTKSLQTEGLKEAKRKVEAEGLDSFMVPQTAREPAVPLPGAVEAKAGVVKVALKEALALPAAPLGARNSAPASPTALNFSPPSSPSATGSVAHAAPSFASHVEALRAARDRNSRKRDRAAVSLPAVALAKAGSRHSSDEAG